MPLTEVVSDKTYTDIINDVEICLGNEQISTEFQAHLKMRFWDEDDIFFELPNVKGTPTLLNDKLVLDTPSGKWEWYKDGDDLKWIFVLKSKPATNKYSLKLGGNWQDFDYFYQTPIPNSKPFYGDAGTSINGEEWIQSQDGRMLRPRKADGSYSVYHKTKKNHIEGQKNYKTGKVCHIYVPKATDSNNKSVWCGLNIDNGTYTVTVPQSFLDSAVYPVVINDTFGYTSVGISVVDVEDQINGSLFTGAAGTATKINAWVNYADPSFPVYKCAIYKHSDLSMLTNGDTGEEQPASDDWDEFTFSVNPTVSAEDYVVCLWGDNTYARGKCDTGDADQGHRDAETYGAWPDPFVLTAHSTNKLSIYVTYTPSGGLSIPVAMNQLRTQKVA